ncbi:MAG: hypothetical protein PVH65_03185 [Chloroflexota bacterium]|jgi:hypothetical protein
MKIEYGNMVALGYGKYFKSDSIIGLEPVIEGRGPGQRTMVYIAQLPEPIIASRSEGAILRDLVETPEEITRVREQRLLLEDIQDTVAGFDAMLRSIIREQGHWDLDRLEEQIEDLLQE